MAEATGGWPRRAASPAARRSIVQPPTRYLAKDVLAAHIAAIPQRPVEIGQVVGIPVIGFGTPFDIAEASRAWEAETNTPFFGRECVSMQHVDCHTPRALPVQDDEPFAGWATSIALDEFCSVWQNAYSIRRLLLLATVNPPYRRHVPCSRSPFKLVVVFESQAG